MVETDGNFTFKQFVVAPLTEGIIKQLGKLLVVAIIN
ncbi:putative ORfan [Saudi moumouvirus]|nr:putative ORfan [Saudi moumouvirus]